VKSCGSIASVKNKSRKTGETGRVTSLQSEAEMEG
jgi:hypothetical protein